MKVAFPMKVPVHMVTQKSVNAALEHLTGGAKGRTNAIGALLNRLLLTVSLFSFNVNSDVFHAWMTQDLLPKVPVGSVIVMDNASFHKREDIIQYIQHAGVVLRNFYRLTRPISIQLNTLGRN